MKFIRYLNEQSKKPESLGDYRESEIQLISDILPLIQKECKPFINDIKRGKKFVYRGMRTGGKLSLKKKIRKDRRPTDTDPNLHDAYNNYFQKEFGWQPRSEGLFVSGNQRFAGNYGEVFTIFPIGRYRYLWSPDIFDLFNSAESGGAINSIIATSRSLVGSQKQLKKAHEEIYGEGKNGSWTLITIPFLLPSDKDAAAERAIEYFEDNDPDYAEIIKKNRELAKKSIKLSLEWKPNVSFDNFIKNTAFRKQESLTPEEAAVVAERLLSGSNYTDDNLIQAIRMGNEIMIDASEYWAVHSHFEPLLEELLFEGKEL